MAMVRDPAFWKRFSLAVHLDEEAQAQASRPELKHSESWLEEQQRKKSKRTCMCWGFWLVFFAFVAGIVVTILLLKSKGII
ncbi:hypothetical protein K491DRAFT_687020 [Lophiostoma macrostomum CBS 122681]|uniref:Uncharacterized protein n=1 Tax=Lophiostoma macrostomum CBS 122681 TaxID=1314788 RepID=A0A6A6TRH5_9PLEO|nr:hypothetical protein K491DRAFT_687020 [Lophiostoma macrostomum CBS 122681]